MPSGGTAAEHATSCNSQFAGVASPTDPADTHLQLLGGTPPVYSLDYDELRINGADSTVPPTGTDFPGGIDWPHGIRDKSLWFEPKR